MSEPSSETFLARSLQKQDIQPLCVMNIEKYVAADLMYKNWVYSDCKKAHPEQIEEYHEHLVSNLQSKFDCNLRDEHRLSDNADNFRESFAESLLDYDKAVWQGVGLSMVILLFTVLKKR